MFIGVGVVLVAVIVFGGTWFVRSRVAARQAAVEHARVVQETRAELEETLVDCTKVENTDTCRESEVRSAALSAKDATVCDVLVGEPYDRCVTDVMVERLDVGGCVTVSSADFCTSRVWFAKAVAVNDYDLCAQIDDEGLRSSCEERLVSSALATRPCQETHLGADACAERAGTGEAVATGNLGICDTLSDGYAQMCRETVQTSDADGDDLPYQDEQVLGTDPLKADTDGDGLLDGEEVLLGLDPKNADMDGDGLPDGEEVRIWSTDPKNPDTDGDGFTDLEETQNGYSPLGSGTLDQ